MFGYHSKPITWQGDVNLIFGTYVFPEVFPELDDIFAEGAGGVHIDLNAYEIAKNLPGRFRLRRRSEADARRARRRAGSDHHARATEAARGRLERAAADEGGARAEGPGAGSRLAGRTCRCRCPASWRSWRTALPDGRDRSSTRRSRCPPDRPLPPAGRNRARYFLTRGGSLGVGFPGAIGAKLANPDKTVIGFSGDGGAMYTIQALWTAARHDVDAKFVVCNNGSYRLLQLNMMAYWQDAASTPRDFPLSFDLSQPALHFADLARSMGVPSVRVEKPWEVAPAIEQMLAAPGPFLIDLVLEGDTHPGLIGITCGQ